MNLTYISLLLNFNDESASKYPTKFFSLSVIIF